MPKRSKSSPVRFILDVAGVYFEKNGGRAAAELVYFLVLSFFPVLICLNAVIGTLHLDVVSILENASVMIPEAAMNVLRLESRVAAVVDYLARLKATTSRIDSTLWPEETLQNDLELLMARLNAIPGRVQEWKKSSARCGADVALCLARVHCKDAREEKLAALRVANTKKHDFRSFMETFLAAATRIADGIDLDEFVAPSSPPQEG